MVGGVGAGFERSAITRRRMVIGGIRRSAVEEVFAQGVALIGGADTAPALQLRNDELDEVFEGARGDRIGQVEAVDTA